MFRVSVYTDNKNFLQFAIFFERYWEIMYFSQSYFQIEANIFNEVSHLSHYHL